MFTRFFNTTGRKVWLLGTLALGLAQVGCAQPLLVEPSVVFSSQIGHAPIYAQVGIPGPVFYPPPRVIYAPQVYGPPVYAPPIYRPAPFWGRGHDPRFGGGNDRHDHRRDERHDGRRDDRRNPGQGGRGDHDGWHR